MSTRKMAGHPRRMAANSSVWSTSGSSGGRCGHVMPASASARFALSSSSRTPLHNPHHFPFFVLSLRLYDCCSLVSTLWEIMLRGQGADAMTHKKWPCPCDLLQLLAFCGLGRRFVIRDRPSELSFKTQSALLPYLYLGWSVLPCSSCEMQALLVLACLAMATARVPMREFSSSKSPLQNVIYLRLPGAEDIVVVAGRNALYKLSAENLSLLATYVTGPQNDSRQCRPYPYDCNYTRIIADNDNQVLLQLPFPHVLACGTISQGMCAIHRPLEDLTVAEPMHVGITDNYVASRVSTVAFFGTGNNKNVLFAASTYDGRPLEYHPYAVSARVLDEHVFTLRSSPTGDFSFVNVIGRHKQKHKIRYLQGFTHKGFAYFVTVQKGMPPPMHVETRITRVCENDTSFRTYTEILIACESGNNRYTNASSAVYGPNEMDRGSSGNVLLVAFSPHDENLTKNSRPKFALCLFDMNRVEEQFRDTINNCNDGKPEEVARWSPLFNNGNKFTCQVYKPRSENMCLPGINNYIEGVAPLLAKSMVTLGSTVTSLTVTQQNQTIVAWVGDLKGNLHKYVISDESTRLEHLWTGYIASVPIERATAVDHDGSHGYFLAGNSVIQLPIGSCIVYRACSDCMQKTADPLQCGWCGDRCAHSHECPAEQWVSNRCPIVVNKVSPKKGPTAGGTMLKIEGDNFASVNNKSEKSGNVTVGGQLCEVIKWSTRRIQCKTPPARNDSIVDIIIYVNDVASSELRKYDPLDHVIPSGFEYKDARLTDIFPNHGPLAGGTSVVLRGTHLDSGSKIKVKIGTKECKLKGINETSVECLSSPVNSSFVGQSLQLRVTTDNTEVLFTSKNNLGSTFTYKPHPVIDGILPVEASVSEDPRINVTGTNLDSVAKPTMVTQVSSARNSYVPQGIEKACMVADGGQEMTCIGPLLTEFSVLSSADLQAHDKPIVAHITFKMDGLLLPLPMNGKPAHFTFTYRLELCVARFPDEGIAVDFWHPVVEIRLVYVDRVYPVGSIRLVKVVKEKPLSWSSLGTIAGITVALLLAFFIGVGVLLYCRFRVRKVQPPVYFVDFDNRLIENRASAGGDCQRHQVPKGGVTKQTTEPAAFQLDEETKAILEADKLLFKREFVVLGPVVGQGHFGCVYGGTLELQGKDEVIRVAVKTLHNNSRGGDTDCQQFLKEALIMKDFTHVNVLPLIGLCLDERDGLMVITPYMKHGDLHSYLRNEMNSPTLRHLITFGIHVAEGMAYLAHLKFVHRDLAARNCLLSEELIVRIADFGLSRDVYEKDYYSDQDRKVKLPVKWMSPESLEAGVYDHKTDVWSYGVLLWELMTRGAPPYAHVDSWDMHSFLKNGRRMQQPYFCPDQLYEIMLQCWELDPQKRPTFARLAADVASVITNLEKKEDDKSIILNVTYENRPRADTARALPPG
ncbi:hepatocyte growth factor receptor-like isoform X2 [Dermacentor albipictus]|uniref:hepatocyte growth factor receptor-like isoform X2 n=1 Tax=Dermacentor albipictus TaxID=60249 RepID=UPI0038FBE7A1